MDGYLAVVSPNLLPSIVSPDAMARIRAVAQHLPPCSLAGFELRLADDQSTIDFGVRLPHGGPGLASPLASNAMWQQVQRLCNAVASRSGPLHAQVSTVMLEFDLDRSPAAIPIPGVFVILRPDHSCTARDLLALADWLQPEQPIHVSFDMLSRCHDALPSAASIGQVGLLSARPGKSLRLGLRGMRAAALFPYLDAVGWHDPPGVLHRLVEEIAPLADPSVILSIDLAETVGPRIGVEFYVRSGTDDDRRWRTLFACLAERGLASPRKMDAILAWPGVTEQGRAGSLWADDLALGDALFYGSAASVFVRSINHIKVAYQPGHAPEVKAYLAFAHSWIATGATDASA